MPRTWIYLIALVLPLVLRLLLLSNGFLEWVWYQGFEQAYYFLSALSVNPMLPEFLRMGPLIFFTCTVFFYWTTDLDDEAVASQFLLLPLIYLPFSILGTWLSTLTFDATLLYTQPLVIIPAGYLYLMPWLVFVWVFSKLRLVM